VGREHYRLKTGREVVLGALVDMTCCDWQSLYHKKHASKDNQMDRDWNRRYGLKPTAKMG
jgi:hypothetical protein